MDSDALAKFFCIAKYIPYCSSNYFHINTVSLNALLYTRINISQSILLQVEFKFNLNLSVLNYGHCFALLGHDPFSWIWCFYPLHFWSETIFVSGIVDSVHVSVRADVLVKSFGCNTFIDCIKILHDSLLFSPNLILGFEAVKRIFIIIEFWWRTYEPLR